MLMVGFGVGIVMLLIATNSVKFHVLHPLPIYVTSGDPHCQSITLETMPIFPSQIPLTPKQIIFILCLHLGFLDTCQWVSGIDFCVNCIRGSLNGWFLKCLSLGPMRLNADAVQFLFFLQACLVVMCDFWFFYPFFFSNLGFCFSQDHPLSSIVGHFGVMNKISTELSFHLGGPISGI